MEEENKIEEQSEAVTEESAAENQTAKPADDLQNDFDELTKKADPSFAKASEGAGGINNNNRDKESLEKELTETKVREAEYLNGWKRALADYANLQKEKERDRKEIVEFSNAALIAELLPIYTNLKKAVRHAEEKLSAAAMDPAVKSWIEGVKMIKRQWEDIFRVVGIEEIKTAGEKFDPEFHSAVASADASAMADKEAVEDIIVEEVEPGYTFKGKVIYPAKVVVS